jgi:predicted Fe-Mo cluster-binding NifX family protein
MKLCFPVQHDNGAASVVYNHFGSAPLFVIIDSETGESRTVVNGDQHHAHGGCNPVKAIGDENIDAVVVGGIGAGALSRLNQLGIRVYRAQLPTIQENVPLLLAQKLQQYMLQECCGGHGHRGTCAH